MNTEHAANLISKLESNTAEIIDTFRARCERKGRDKAQTDAALADIQRDADRVKAAIIDMDASAPDDINWIKEQHITQLQVDTVEALVDRAAGRA